MIEGILSGDFTQVIFNEPGAAAFFSSDLVLLAQPLNIRAVQVIKATKAIKTI